MKKFQIILMAVLLAAGMGYSAVITNLVVDFTGQTVGSQPTGASSVRPLIDTASNYVRVVSDSGIGQGNAVRIYDNNNTTNTGGNGVTGVEYNFVASSNHQENAVGVKFTFAQRSTTATATVNFNISVGEYTSYDGLNLNSSGKRIAEFQIRDNGMYRSVFGGSTTNLFGLPGLNVAHTVELFVNDQDSASVNYLQNGTNYSLAANSYAIWIDNITGGYGGIYGAVLVDGGTATANTTEWNLGRIGFSSNGGAVGLDADFDNIIVTSLIPEPATMGMLLLGAVTVLAVRRRRA